MKKNTKRFRIFIIIATIIASVLVFFYWSLLMPHYRYGSTSPDGKYIIDVYEEPKPFFTMPGNGSSNGGCKLVLRNRWGFKIARSPDEEHFGLEFCNKESASFKWDLNKGFVWYECNGYSLAGFDLVSKKFEQ